MTIKNKKMEDAHNKQLETKKFLIGKLKEERQHLQFENKQLIHTMKEEKQKMISQVLTLEEDNEQIRKELKSKKIMKDQHKSSEQISKLKEEINNVSSKIIKNTQY
jgi:hypothetical protein